DIYSFTLSLAHEFDAQQQVAGAELLLQDLILLPAEMDAANADDSELKSAAELLYIDLPHMNSKQLRTYRLVVLDFVHRLLTSQQFRSKYRTADLTPEVSQQLSSAVSTVLELITKMSTQYGQLTQKQRLTTQASDRAWKQSIHIAYNVIDDVNSLMDRRSFVQTVAKLLAQTDYKIRRKVLALAQKRIEAFDTRLYEADAKPIDDMLELVGSVVDVVDEKVDESAEGFSQKEFVANKQAALLCVAAAARKFASLRPVLFTKLVKRVSGQESLDSAHPVVVSAALVTLAVLCSELGSRLIPSLPMFLPSILKHMHAVTGNYRSASADDVAVLLSAMGAMETVVENMSAFLVPSLAPLFTCLLNPVLRAVVEEKAEESDDESEDSVLDSLRSQVLAKVD
ncbi:snoRNA-binding rRNA-processing protein utp10, partial [Linderina macrospora]